MWIPFSRRCKLSIISIIHKSIDSFNDSNISDLIKNIQYYFLFVTKMLLIVHNSNKTSLNSRTFNNSGPALRNSLPPTIRSIRSHKRCINITSSFLSTHSHYIIHLIIFVRVKFNVYYYKIVIVLVLSYYYITLHYINAVCNMQHSTISIQSVVYNTPLYQCSL